MTTTFVYDENGRKVFKFTLTNRYHEWDGVQVIVMAKKDGCIVV
jgi:hypothetical protein